MHFDDENNLVKDEYGNRWYTINNPVIEPNGKFESALHTNGSNYVYTNHDDDSLLTTGKFTIECWCYFYNIRSTYTGVWDAYRNWTTDYNGFSVCINPQRYFTLWVSSNGSNWNIANNVQFGTATTNTWYHIAICRDDTSVKCFYNGKLNATVNVSKNIRFYNSNYSFNIGTCGYSNNIGHMDGLIDDFRIIKGAAIYSRDFELPNKPFNKLDYEIRKKDTGQIYIKSLLHFDDSVTEDEIADNKWIINGNPFISNTNAKFNSCLWVNDTLNSGIYLDNPILIGGCDFTVDFVGCIGSSSFGAFFSCSTNKGIAITDGMRPGAFWIGTYNTTNTLNIGIDTIYGSSQICYNYYDYQISNVKTDIEHHYAFVYKHDIKQVTIYVDGSNIKTFSSITIDRIKRYFAIFVNNYSNTNYCRNSYIDEFRISDGIARWTENFTPPDKPYVVD